MESYSYFSSVVTEIIENASPLYEKTNIDEFYVDMTEMKKYFGSYKWSMELREKIRKETGLPISFGIAVNKSISIIVRIMVILCYSEASESKEWYNYVFRNLA